MSNKDENTRPESLTLRLKKAEAAVEAATESLKSLRTVVESEGRGIANQAEQKHGDNLSKDLKKLNKQQAVVRKVLDKP
jgi:vacuolar-type H+-ATPase subunit H